MILTREESIFLLVLVLNLVIALAYFIYGTIIAAPVKTRKEKGKRKCCAIADGHI